MMTPYGIIPAYAGLIEHEHQNADGTGDHPRIRGTNSTFYQHQGPHLGSSPHTRD